MLYSIQTFVILTLISVTCRLISNFWKVKSVPGPFLASCTSLWQFYFKRNGELLQKLEHLHAKYGPVVRYAPNTVSVSDPAAIRTVYGFAPVWTKPPSYHPMMGIRDGKIIPSIISIVSEERHTALKRLIAPAFTNKAVLLYEKFVDETTDELIKSLSELGSCDLALWMQYFTMDVLSRVAFSESLGFVTKGEDIGSTMSTIEERFRHWNLWSALPSLEWLIYKNPLYLKVVGSTSPLTTLAASKLQLRNTGQHKEDQSDLLQKYIEAREAHPEIIDDATIIGLTMSTIAAGADTTAITLAASIYYLLKYPEVLSNLNAEIKSLIGDSSAVRSAEFSDFNKLLYLEAVIKESMRCWSIFTAPIERVVPREGIKIADNFLPGGTVVGCHQSIIHMNYTCYGNDATSFNPNRWLDTNSKQRLEMDRASLWFGSGKHICLGRHIAMLEIKKLIPRLLSTFRGWFFDNSQMTVDDPSTPLKAKTNAVAYLEPIFVTFERI